MLYPSIDKLLQKIPSKYSLIGLASKRAKAIRVNNEVFLKNGEPQKPVQRALEEIVDEQVYIVDAETFERTIREAKEATSYSVSGQEEL